MQQSILKEILSSPCDCLPAAETHDLQGVGLSPDTKTTLSQKDQVFRLKVWVTKSLLMRPLSTLLSRVDISSRVIILSVFFPYSCTSDFSFYLSSTKFWHPHVLAAHTKSQGQASSMIELFDNHLVWEKISWLEWAVVQLWDWGTRRQQVEAA